jgi:uncharacterized protein YbjQ (UPF0145 family)
MKMSTIYIDRSQYEVLGIVKGSVVRAANVVKDVVSNLKNLTGGELTHYSKLIDMAVNDAMEKMIESAEKIGADEIIGVRISTTSVTQGGAEIIVYGTAVKKLDK